MLCIPDEKKNPIKQHLFPIVDRRGYYDIVIHQKHSPDTHFKNKSSQKFYSLLRNMIVGDELAFKGGANSLVLNEHGDKDSVKDVSITAVGLGIIPVIPIIKSLLNKRATKVRLVWVNSSPSDYFLSQAIDSIVSTYPKRFEVFKLIVSDLLHSTLSETKSLYQLIDPFVPGSLAIVSAPEDTTFKLRKIFRDMYFPVDSIITLLPHE